MTDIQKWELAGIGIIFFLGFLLHDAYDFSGQKIIVGIFAPVNESVWEHLKMAVTAILIFAMAEYFLIGSQANNFILGKALSIIVTPLFIIIFHYGYRIFTGHHVVILDIIFFLVAIAIGQFLSYRILSYSIHYSVINSIALIVVVIIVLSFIYLTFYPLKLPIFRDELTGGYGLN